METGSIIPKWRPSVFETQSNYVSAIDCCDILSKFGMEIDLPHIKQVSLIEIA